MSDNVTFGKSESEASSKVAEAQRVSTTEGAKGTNGLCAFAPLREKLFDCIANQKTITGYEPASPATVYLEPRKLPEAEK